MARARRQCHPQPGTCGVCPMWHRPGARSRRHPRNLESLIADWALAPSRHRGGTRGAPTCRGGQARSRRFIRSDIIPGAVTAGPHRQCSGVLAASSSQGPRPPQLSRFQFCSPQPPNVRKVLQEVKGRRLFLDPTGARPCSVGNAPSSQRPQRPQVPQRPAGPSTLIPAPDPPSSPQAGGHRTADTRWPLRLLPAGPAGCLLQRGQAAAALCQTDCSVAATAPCFLPHFLPAPGARGERQAQRGRVDH